MPFGFVAALIALQAMLAEKPFDAMIAPAEIASGPMVELGGKLLGMAFLQHAVAIFIETGLVVNMFLGGAGTIWIFFVKQLVLYAIVMAFNGIYARYRVEQATSFLWVFAGGLAFVQLVINAVTGGGAA
jgi:NADH-quinone oxidoreductase subunit H